MSAYIPYSQRHGSISSLHYGLGKLIEDRPGVRARSDGGGTFSTDDRPFEDFEPVRASVDWASLDRLEAEAATFRDEDPVKWERLQSEWRQS